MSLLNYFKRRSLKCHNLSKTLPSGRSLKRLNQSRRFSKKDREIQIRHVDSANPTIRYFQTVCVERRERVWKLAAHDASGNGVGRLVDRSAVWSLRVGDGLGDADESTPPAVLRGGRLGGDEL